MLKSVRVAIRVGRWIVPLGAAALWLVFAAANDRLGLGVALLVALVILAWEAGRDETKNRGAGNG